MSDTPGSTSDLARGRLFLVIAAILWSTSGAFTKVLTTETPFGLHLPHSLDRVQIACSRVLFAGLILLPTVRRRSISFRPLMIFMVLSFALMNITFIAAIAQSSAANAIFLQYSAPLWMFLASVWLLGEKADQRSLITLIIGSMGIVIILVGGWQSGDVLGVSLGLASGFTYACVLLCLRVMRSHSSEWMTVINHLIGGLIVLPYVLWLAPPMPSPAQWLTLFLFGTLQMGIPYLLVAKGLQTVSPQEAGAITLIEPVLTPIFTYLVSGEQPGNWTLVGGAFIIGALAWRYRPRRGEKL